MYEIPPISRNTDNCIQIHFQDGYTKVTKTIKLSNHLPAGVSYKIFKTFTDFSIVSCKMSNNVVEQSNDIVISELPAVKLKL